MEHEDKTFNETMHGLLRNVAHLTQTVSQAFNFLMTFFSNDTII